MREKKESMRRLLSLALSVSLIMGGMTPFTAAASTKTTAVDICEFEVSSEELREALENVMRSGSPINGNAYRFSGEQSDDYEELFYSNDVYELSSDLKVKDGRGLTLKVFAVSDGDQELDSYSFTGNENIIFLIQNKTDKEKMARIVVDDLETDLIPVASKTKAADSGRSFTESDRRRAETKEVKTGSFSYDTSSDVEDNISDDMDKESDETDKESGDTDNESDSSGSSSDVKDSGSDYADSDSGSSENVSDYSDSSSDDSGSHSSSADNDNESTAGGSDNSVESNQVSASVSLHRLGLLSSYPDEASEDGKETYISESENVNILIASISDAEESYTEDTELYNRLNGEIFDAVTVNSKLSAVAFVTTLEDLGIDIPSVKRDGFDNQTIQAKVYNNASYDHLRADGTSIRLSGVMPQKAVAKAYPVDVEIEGTRVLAAYDITIFDENGSEYQPEEGMIEVEIENDDIRRALADDRRLTVYHMKDKWDAPEEVAVISEEDMVIFMADRFSIYVVGEDGTYTDVENNEETDVYTFYFHKYIWDDEDHGDTIISVQTVAVDDSLSEPASPEVDHHIFDGWYTTRQDEESGEHEGYQYDFDRSVKDNLESWDNFEPEQMDGRYIVNLYSDYDQIYYVYFMSEEVPVIDHGSDYRPYVLYTGEYSEKDDKLSTKYATEIYQEVYLGTNYAVTSWYLYDGTEKTLVYDGYQVTDDIILYPIVEGVIWIYFDMGGASSTEVTAIEPTHVDSDARQFGSAIPEDPKRAGYSFAGWYANEDYSGEVITPDTDPQDIMQGNIITLYAKWEEMKAAYIVNFWRQKQTSSVEAKASDYGDYSNEYDLVLTDYIGEDEVDALTTGSPVSDVLEVPDWSVWTGYDEAATNANDKYWGFEYAKDRTEKELTGSAETILGDGSTIINIYYDRVTITWNFYNVPYSDRNTTDAKIVLTLTGLWGAQLESGEWPSVDIAGNDEGSWIWSHHQNSTNTEYRFDTSYKFIPAGNKSNAVCNFYLLSINDGGTLYIYKEVLTPVVGSNGYEHTDSEGNVHYYELYTSITLNAGTDYGVSEKFDTHYVSGRINSIGSSPGNWQDTTTNGGTSKPEITVDNDPDQVVLLFYDLNKYDVHLYSHGKEYSEATYRYGEEVAPLPSRDEMMQAVEEDETLRPAYYYEFAGWGSADGTTIEVSAPDTMPGYDLTYYAIWKLKEIEVTYHSGVQDDAGVSGMPADETLLATNTATEPEKPARSGYTFVGWQTEEGEYFDFSTVLYDDTDLTAIWFMDGTGHTLTYMVDIEGEYYSYTVGTPFIEGTEEIILNIEDVLEVINTENNLNLSEEELTGLAAGFLCWNTSSTGTGTSYYPDSEYTFGTEDAIVYAKWVTEKKSALILDYNYPEGYIPGEKDANPTERTSLTTENLENISLSAGTGMSELATKIITVDGKVYVFVGWSTDKTAGSPAIGPDDTVAVDNLKLENGQENILYAIWVQAAKKDVNIDTSVNVGDELTYTITYANYNDEPASVKITDVLDAGLDFLSASKDGTYAEDTRTVTWSIENVKAYAEESVTLTVRVNENALVKNEVENTAQVQVGNDPAVDTNRVVNPIPSEPQTPGSHSSGSGGSGSGRGSGGNSSGGPGVSDGGSAAEGDIWNLLPLPQTGQGRAMLIGACILVVSAAALAMLLWLKRKNESSM